MARETFAPVSGTFREHVAVVFSVVVSGVCHEYGDNANDDLDSEGNDNQHDDSRIVPAVVTNQREWYLSKTT